MVFALEDSLQKTIVLRWNEYSFCSYMGPNQVRIMDQMASRLSVRPQVSFIKTNRYVEGIGLRLIGFCVTFLLWFDGLSLVTFFGLFAVNSLNLSRPRLINLAKIWKPLLLL